MADVVKLYTQPLNKTRFIGKRYSDEDRENGGFGHKWGEFFQNKWFEPLQALSAAPGSVCEDDDAFVGLMRHKEGEAFQYWIGMFLPPETVPPEGYGFVDFEPSTLGTAWLKGPENDLYGQEYKASDELTKAGHAIATDKDGATWLFERYAEQRFCKTDEDQSVILDICFFIQ